MSLSAATQTVQIAAAVIKPVISLGAVTAASIAPGKSGSILITVTNSGNVAASGIDIALSPSADGVTPIAGVILKSMQSGVAIQPGKSKKFELRFTIPSAFAAGSYFPYVLLTLENATTTGVGDARFAVE